MKNTEIVSEYLKSHNLYPSNDPALDLGIQISVTENRELLIRASANELIELSDLLISLATSKNENGEHFHIDDLTLINEDSSITDVIVEKK